jgi:hypothetical protein
MVSEVSVHIHYLCVSGSMQTIVVERASWYKATHPMVARKDTERIRKRPGTRYNPKDTSPMTYFLQLGLTFIVPLLSIFYSKFDSIKRIIN